MARKEAKAVARKAKAKPETDAERRARLLKMGEKDPKGLMLTPPRGMDNMEMAKAMDAIDGTTDNAIAVWSWGAKVRPSQDLHVTHCAEALRDEVGKAQNGDLSQVDAMLFGQAKVLSSVFHALLARAGDNLGQHLGAVETYMRLALKAQSQCRTTLEALVEAKNPRSVAFVRQANIATGHQQVNNGDARTNATQPNELQGDFNVVDAGAEAARIGVDAPAAAVAQVNRAKNRRRKVAIKPQRVEGRNKTGAQRA